MSTEYPALTPERKVRAAEAAASDLKLNMVLECFSVLKRRIENGERKKEREKEAVGKLMENKSESGHKHGGKQNIYRKYAWSNLPSECSNLNPVMI